MIEEQPLIFHAVIFLFSWYNHALHIWKQLVGKLQQANHSSIPWDRFLYLFASCATCIKCLLIDIFKLEEWKEPILPEKFQEM